MLYCIVAPIGAATTIVPVGVVQVGCTVTEAVGADTGVNVLIKTDPVELQLAASVTVTV